MFLKPVKYLVFIFLSITLLSCSKFTKIQKSQDFQYKYDKALEYYEKQDYYRALNLFDQVMPFFRGTDQAENIAYKYAYAYYYQKEYIMANYYFGRFAKTFPRSDKAEECAYMAAYCKYLDSPRYELDQTNTKQAIQELQVFINTYPNSERVKQSNDLIDELREKLQLKAFEIAKLYFKMEKYKASVTSFASLLKDYPDTKYKEDAMFYSIKSYYYYAQKSVRSKRNERYHEAINIYNDFIAQYPDSKYMHDVKYMYDRAIKDLGDEKIN